MSLLFQKNSLTCCGKHTLNHEESVTLTPLSNPPAKQPLFTILMKKVLR